ncbi:thiamine phosphate synthase [Sphingomonas baiyangensis]|nr:thiamine phosphate synthase [Sphingomonas baiyangensis]
MTDERMGDALWPAIERLPRGGGIVFRHYATPEAERRRLFARILVVARRRGLIVLSAGTRLSGADGMHNPARRAGRCIVTRAAHSRIEALAALRAGAKLVFVSPVFATQSHPGARALGVLRFATMVRGIEERVVALGGMDATRARCIVKLGVRRWAAIDAWSSGQKRKAVPT